MTRWLQTPAGKKAKWVIVALWLVALAATAPFGMKFEDAQSNESSSFLPGDTDSLEALQLSEQFPSGENVPAIIVFRRESGLTATDRDAIAATARELGRDLPAVARPPLPTSFSPDGNAAVINIPMDVGGDSDALLDAVKGFRAKIEDTSAGLDATLGGPAGFSADAIEVFGNINSTLLLATASIVIVLLLLIYRSPIFWLIPVVAVFAAEFVVRAVGYGLTQIGVTVNGQSAGIMLVLVFGAGTDYALLLVSRFREELHHYEDRHEAMRVALSQSGPAILASAGTVIAGLLCLSLAQVNGTQGLGAIGAVGVATAALSMLTLLPALLVILGRGVFWPFVPRFDESGSPQATRGVFRGLGEWIARRPRPVWIGVSVALLVMCGGLAALSYGLTSANGFRGEVDAVEAQELISRSFPGGTNAPTDIVVRDVAKLETVRDAVRDTPGVASIGDVEAGPPGARFDAVLDVDPYTEEAYDLIPVVRDNIERAAGDGVALVGGATAVERDVRVASARDTLLLPPIVLLVVFLILMWLLRSVVAPLLLIGTVILSFLAALGVSVVAFDWIFGFPGVDPSFPLFGFIFLVALGVDYNIFLMARVREETARFGTREGMLRGLAATGSVITSAGIVLAGTFAVLGVLPLVALTEIGFVVAFGVLLDTVIVRSILVPALVFDLDRRTWWPSPLARKATPADTQTAGGVTL
jgi:RND superfamily putative drug exporter